MKMCPLLSKLISCSLKLRNSPLRGIPCPLNFLYLNCGNQALWRAGSPCGGEVNRSRFVESPLHTGASSYKDASRSHCSRLRHVAVNEPVPETTPRAMEQLRLPSGHSPFLPTGNPQLSPEPIRTQITRPFFSAV